MVTEKITIGTENIYNNFCECEDQSEIREAKSMNFLVKKSEAPLAYKGGKQN